MTQLYSQSAVAVRVVPVNSTSAEGGARAAGAEHAVPPAGSELALLGQRVGNYVVERPLGRGGMAQVYVAKHAALGRQVAVKFLSSELSGQAQLYQRFLQEAQVMANLSHPNVVDIFDFGELAGRYYYVMELLLGEDLSAVIRRTGRFPHEELVGYVQQICSALDAAHSAGVVHRDLKPANIFVLDGQDLHVKLMDFGVAKVQRSDVGATLGGQILGTPSHMAPEQVLGRLDLISPASDLYGLGVILYEMLTGRLPFDSESDIVTMSMHVREPVPPIRSLAPDVPARVAELVESCLQKQPEKRPRSAREFAAHIAAVSKIAARAFGAVSSGAVRACPEDLAEPLPTGEGLRTEAPLSPGAGQVDVALLELGSERLAPEALRSLELPSGPLPQKIDAPETPLASAVAPHPQLLSDRVDEGGASPPEPGVSDQRLLDQLLRRMKRHPDFPAFVSNVTEISRKADADNKYSASQVGESIVKDFALTAKLLRLVNTNYANRFGGKVFSVQQAVVILGFDSVRSTALGVSVFKKPAAQKHKRSKGDADRVAESAINSLVSGEIARALAPAAGLKDAELAMMCALFRNVGYHLVLHYLPERFDEVQALAAEQRISLAHAADRVLGISFQKLGLAVGERWRLPKPLLDGISTNPGPGEKLEREQDRMGALAKLANDLAHAVATASPESWHGILEELLRRNKPWVSLDAKAVAELLEVTRRAFEERYAAAFGVYSKKSRFLKNARALAGGTTESTPIRPKLTPSDVETQLGEHVRRLRAAAVEGAARQALVQAALVSVRDALAIPRLLLLGMAPNGHELCVQHALGADAEALIQDFRVPLTRGGDVFSSAWLSGREILVEDTYTSRATQRIPQRYYEMLGSPALAIQPCRHSGQSGALLVVDADSAEALPAPDLLQATGSLRSELARTLEWA